MGSELIEHTDHENVAVHRLLFLQITLDIQKYASKSLHPPALFLMVLPIYQSKTKKPYQSFTWH